MGDGVLIEKFQDDPEGAYALLLERYTPVMLGMIRRFMHDPDEVMEVYTAICERLRAYDYQALRRFRMNSEITPWLSVVVANACRDRFRKRRMQSVPQSVLSRLDTRERLVFKYYYQSNLSHQEIAETVTAKHSIACSVVEVVKALEKIEGCLSTNKRWHLLSALRANRAVLSLDDLGEDGYWPEPEDAESNAEEALQQHESLQHLNQVLDSLQPEDHLLVLLRFEQGMRAHQIAQVMQYDNYKYVYTRLRTIVSRLRRQLAYA
jgi:DNA-directed RNA polymerase specialized sigma24 family protein